MLGLQSVEPVLGNGLPEVVELRQIETVRRVTTAGRCLFSSFCQAFERVLADRLQHVEPPLPIDLFRGLQETFVDQSADALEDGRSNGYLLCSLEREAADEDRELTKHHLRYWVKQFVAPGDRLSHRLQACRGITRATREELQAVRQPRQQSRRRKESHPRRGELDRQRQPVQSLTDLGH